MTAAMAFAGATFAQILQYQLAARRKKLDEKDKSLKYVEALISEIDHCNMNISMIIAFLEKNPFEDYVFKGDKFAFYFNPELYKKFEYSLLVHPGIYNRGVNFFGIYSRIYDVIQSEKPIFSKAGYRFIFIWLLRGLHLASELDRVKYGGDIMNQGNVPLVQITDRFRSYTFSGGGTHLNFEQFNELYQKFVLDEFEDQ